MPCFYPLTAWRGKIVNPTGKRPLVFSANKAQWSDKPLEIACGQCTGCRLDRSRQWAMRCMHEAQLYEKNIFLTLTFDEATLYKRSNPFTVDVRDFQLFMKRLRKKYGKGIRFYHCGEYGECCRLCGRSRTYCDCGTFHTSLGRPHYHACIFNHDFDDKELYRVTHQGKRLYTSRSLSDLWPFGFATFGGVEFESAAYVARYIMKKVNGEKADEIDAFSLRPYERMNLTTGEVFLCAKEYTTMSRGGRGCNGENLGGIGKRWYDEYKDDVYPHDYVVVNGVKCRPPKYYDGLLEADRPYLFDDVILERVRNYNKSDLLLLKEYGNLYSIHKSKRLDDQKRNLAARLKMLPRNL